MLDSKRFLMVTHPTPVAITDVNRPGPAGCKHRVIGVILEGAAAITFPLTSGRNEWI